jgi:DNA-binding transcriptional regulator YhcF (GntR family)
MRLWFAPSSEVPIYRQLVTQVVLAILAGDLRPGDRLPSTRELARRFNIHPNTISAGYRQLEREGWTEHRRGSGVHIRANEAPPSTPEQILDHHIAGFFRAVRELNLPAPAIRQRVAEWLVAPPPDHFLLIDPDPELRRILLTELAHVTTFPVSEASVEEGVAPASLIGAIPLCRPSKTKLIRAALPAGIELVTLPIRSANQWLSPWLPSLNASPAAKSTQLIGIASHWPEFLAFAQTMLTAAALDPDTLIFRDATQPRWTRGLDQTQGIICDAYTATVPAFPHRPQTFIFPFLADNTRERLSAYTHPTPAL